MDRVYQANAIETPPSTIPSSGSFPTAGNKASGQLATVPGPYWFYSITEEIRNALIAAGVTPDAAKVNQLAEAMSKFLPLSGGNVTGNLTVQSKNVVRSVNGTAADAAGNVELAGAYVTETWKNGTSWYRKWSDGWIEQGGSVGTSGLTKGTTTLNVPFTNTTYKVFFGLTGGKGSYNSDTSMDIATSEGTKTTTSFGWNYGGNGASPTIKAGFHDWYAFGY